MSIWGGGLALVAMLLVGNARAREVGPDIRPVPAWVSSVTVPASPGAGKARPVDGVRYLLVDDQIALHASSPVEFRHIAYEVVTGAGKAEASQFRVSFQPDYQSVAMHFIRVERDGAVRDVLPTARFDLLRREASLEQGILDGDRTWHVLLPDIRVGDRIEYAFSITGNNPVFGGRYFGTLKAAYGVDLPLRRVEVVRPTSRPLQTRMTHAGFTHAVSRSERIERQIWSARNLQAYENESDAPSWFDPGGQLQLAEARSWTEIVQWALPLYPTRFRDRQIAKELAADTELADQDVSLAAQRALSFVQDQIRYTGLEAGVGSHAPASPETTLARRFGDCKDKAVLLVAMLAEVGIRAEPVLVDIEARQAIDTHLASPLAFDHVIVRVLLGNRWFYVDPTLENQAGPIEDREPQRYGLGLPIVAGVTGLVEIPRPPAATPDLEVDQGFVLTFDEPSMRGSADVTVSTLYRRGRADRIRARFALDGAEEIGKQYLDYMRGYYPDIVQVQVPSLTDDAGGELRVVERYRVGWTEGSGAGGLPLTLFQLLDWVPHRKETSRASPLVVDGPDWARHRIRAEYRHGWRITDEEASALDPHFSVHRTVRRDGNTLVLTAEWRKHSDEVAGPHYVAARAKMQEARELLDYAIELGAPNAAPQRTNRWAWILLGFVFIAGSLGAAWRYRETSLAAGVIFRPKRTFSAATTARSDLSLPVAALVVLAIGGALLDVDSNRLVEGDMQSVATWGRSAGASLLWSLASAAGILVVLRVMRHRASYVELLRASGYGALPLLVFLCGALIVLAGDTSWIADPEAGIQDDAMWGAAVTVLMLLTGGIWTFISTVRAYSGVASVPPSRVLAAVIGSSVAIVMAVIAGAALIAAVR